MTSTAASALPAGKGNAPARAAAAANAVPGDAPAPAGTPQSSLNATSVPAANTRTCGSANAPLTPSSPSAGPAARTSSVRGRGPATTKPPIRTSSPVPTWARVATLIRRPAGGATRCSRYVDVKNAVCSMVRALSASPGCPAATPSGADAGAGAVTSGFE